jgi:hypothetical protein
MRKTVLVTLLLVVATGLTFSQMMGQGQGGYGWLVELNPS